MYGHKIFSGETVKRENLGLPNNWSRVREWIDFKGPLKRYPVNTTDELANLNNPEIPSLEDYSKIPDEKFWTNFPFKELPTHPESGALGPRGGLIP